MKSAAGVANFSGWRRCIVVNHGGNATARRSRLRYKSEVNRMVSNEGHLMKKTILAGAWLLISVGLAGAADMPFKAQPPRPATSWSGWYVGVNGGSAWNSDNSGTFSYAGPLAPVLSLHNQFPTTLAPNTKGGLGGLQTGYNWQISPMWLIGVETDIQLSNYSGTAIANPTPIGTPFAFTTTLSQQSAWFGTLRGRAGLLATPNLLVYGTGGLAYGQTETSFTTVLAGSSLGTCPPTFTCATGSASSNRTGWAAGGGLEWMFAPHWTLRGEYLYVDLGSQSVTAPSLNTIFPPVNFTATSVFHENIARAAVDFGF
jgi:outer membrane immunogenic protein